MTTNEAQTDVRVAGPSGPVEKRRPFYFFNGARELLIGGLRFASFKSATEAAREANKECRHGLIQYVGDAPELLRGAVAAVDEGRAL